jgi:amino acid permease
MVNKSLLTAVAILTGTMIGAGFLGIPYAVSKSGFLPGLIMLLLIAMFMMLMKLYMGEVALRTKGTHQLAGYAEIYLGNAGKYLMFFAIVFGIYSALVAYLIGEGQNISFILFGNSSYSFFIAVFFWGVVSFLSFIGLTALKKYERLGLGIVILFLVLISFFFAPKVSLSNLSYVSPDNLFFPFGVILFSFLAFSAMPEIERVLAGREYLMKRAIIIGSMVSLIVYVIFTFLIVGSFGRDVPEIASLALGRVFSILGVVTMFTAFFSSSIAVRDVFRFDFKLGRYQGWLLASFIPLFLYLFIDFFKLFSFIQILSLAGVISGGMTGILVLLMNKESKKYGKRKPEYRMHISWPLIILFALIFLVAVVLELLI